MKNKISVLQYAVFAGLTSLAFSALYKGSASCFTLIITAIIGFLFLIPTLLTSSNNTELSLLLKALIFVFVTLLATYLVNSYSQFFTAMVNPDTPKWFIALLLLSATFYPCIKGIEAVTRGALISSVFVIIALVLTFVLMPFSDFNSFRDIEYVFTIDNSVVVLMMFSPFILSLLFRKNVNKSINQGVVITFIISLLVFIMVVGFGKLLSITEYDYMFYALSEISCNIMPMGLSGVFIAFSLISVFFGILYFNESLKAVTNIDGKALPALFLTIVYVLSILTMYVRQINAIVLNKYLLAVLFVIIAVALPISLKAKEKSND